MDSKFLSLHIRGDVRIRAWDSIPLYSAKYVALFNGRRFLLII